MRPPWNYGDDDADAMRALAEEQAKASRSPRRRWLLIAAVAALLIAALLIGVSRAEGGLLP